MKRGDLHANVADTELEGRLTDLYRRYNGRADFLTVYARAFDSVEVDSTFYATAQRIERPDPGIVVPALGAEMN
jgi:hypothetical protein